MDGNQPTASESKRRFQLWIKPSTLELVGNLYELDNCTCRGEFIEKAIQFYAGYLASNRNEDYFSQVIVSTLKGIVAESDNRQNRMIFKLAVELAVIENLLAANEEIDSISLQRLRAECVKEVRRLNGSFQFEDALEWQRA